MTGDNSQLDRHARHIALAQIGPAGQARISRGSALIIGTGGIGCAASSYLASSGVGNLLLCDFDTVDATNLGRQFLYGPADIGKLKAECAAARLEYVNPDIRITAISERLDDAALAEAVREADVVLDGSDNFTTRFQVNDACVSLGRCLISGSAIRLEGQVAVFGPDYASAPCYRCLYQEADESLENCAGNGVLAAVPGVVGTLMAVETLKFLAGIESHRSRLTLYSAGSGEFRAIGITKRADCKACSLI